jgi:hypothetical protein
MEPKKELVDPSLSIDDHLARFMASKPFRNLKASLKAQGLELGLFLSLPP